MGRSVSPLPIDTSSLQDEDLCSICLECFNGRKVKPTVVETKCGHIFDRDCFSQAVIDQPSGSRKCAMCRKNPMPVTNKATGECYQDTFFPDKTFFTACFDGNLQLLRTCLAQPVNVNVTLNNGLTALMLASLRGHTEIVKLLLENGAKVDAELHDAGQNTGRTPLHAAAQKGHTDIVKLLLENGAKVDAELHDAGQNTGWTPLHAAAQQGHTDIVKLLLEKGVKVDAELHDAGQNTGWTALHAAAQQRHTDIVKLLLENGAKVDAELHDAGQKTGWTPLHAAAQSYLLVTSSSIGLSFSK